MVEYRTENYEDRKKYRHTLGDRDMYHVRDKRNHDDFRNSGRKGHCRNRDECDEDFNCAEQYGSESKCDRCDFHGSNRHGSARHRREELDCDERTPSKPDSLGSSIRRSKSGKKKWTPVCDMGETEKYWLIRCEVPGVRKDKIKVEIEGKELIIKGKRIKELWNMEKLGLSTVETKEEKKSEDESQSGASVPGTAAPAPSETTSAHKHKSGFRSVNWMDKERGGRGTYKKKIRLPQRVDQSAIQALYKDGILEVLIKKPDSIEYKKKPANKLIAIH